MDNIVILGAGESGVGAALLAHQQGYAVWVSDGGAISDVHKNELKVSGIEFEEKQHSMEQISKAAVVIKSPGIPEKADIVKMIRALHIPIVSEIEFAYRYKEDSKIIGITGSNGKTTTTSMIYHILETAGFDVAVVGNIGYSFARQVATNPKKYYVAEISSFQLDDIQTFRPDVSVLTNITEDHLDRYEYKFENYIKSKFSILKYQTAEDVFIYDEDDEVTMNYLTHFINHVKALPISMRKKISEGAFISDFQMHVRFKDEEIKMSVEDFALKGKHNMYNSMAASLAAVAVGVKKENIRTALATMESLDHRMQHVVTIGGVDFINDSKATNVNSTWYALESIDKPVVLILGGVDKGNDYRILNDLVKEKVRAIVCLGIDNQKIHESFKGMVDVMLDTASAVEAAEAGYRLAQKGDVVLLSPACASFDLFKNYEDRGQQFIAAVKNL